MKKTPLILQAIIFLVFHSLSLAATEIDEKRTSILPENYLLRDIPDEMHNEFIHLNNTIILSDIYICNSDAPLNNTSPCFTKHTNYDYLLNLKTGSASRVNHISFEYQLLELGYVEKLFMKKVRDFLITLIAQHDSSTQLSVSNSSHGDLGTDWCSSSPEIFSLSCRQHDFCYESGAAKGVCDDVFYDNMFKEAHLYTENSTEPTYQELAAYLAIALAYFEAVVHSSVALDAFCAATSGDFDLCDDSIGELVDQNDNEHSGDINGGNPVGEWGSGTTGALNTIGLVFELNYTCQLWKFPDGNGSFYYLWRECMYSVGNP